VIGGGAISNSKSGTTKTIKILVDGTFAVPYIFIRNGVLH